MANNRTWDSFTEMLSLRDAMTQLRSHCTALDRASYLASAPTYTRLCNDFLWTEASCARARWSVAQPRTKYLR